MSIVSSIKGSQNDLDRPRDKSYWGFGFDTSLVNVGNIREKKNPGPTEKRMLGFDLSKKEYIKEIIVLDNNKKELGRFTTEQIREIFDDMGFNVNPTFGGKHLADIEAVMNIGGYSIPILEQILKEGEEILRNYEKEIRPLSLIPQKLKEEAFSLGIKVSN